MTFETKSRWAQRKIATRITYKLNSLISLQLKVTKITVKNKYFY